MNFSPLKVLIPNRGMLIVLLAIGLAIGWYAYGAEKTSNKLIKRNFNYLNHVADNINASVDAVTAAVPFNNRNIHGCIESSLSTPTAADASKNTTLQEATEQCLEDLKARLLKHGSLVSNKNDVGVNTGKVAGIIPFASLGTSTICKESGDQYQAKGLVSDIEKSMTNIVPAGILNMYYLYGHSYTNSSKSNTLAECKAVKGTGKTEDLFAAHFTITVPFEKVRGIASTENVFDVLMVANYDGDESEVLFSNTEVTQQISKDDITDLFNTRTGFERFSNLREFERANALMHGPTPSPDDKKISASHQKFTQSTLVPITIGGFSHLAFIQPLRSEYTGQKEMLLIGIIEESSFNKKKYAVSYNWSSNALLLLIVGIFSLNIFKIKLLRTRGVINRSDAILAAISLIGIVSLLVVFLMHLMGSLQMHAMFDRDMDTLEKWISTDFSAEVDDKVDFIREKGQLLAAMKTEEITGSDEASVCNPVGTDAGAIQHNIKYECTAKAYPQILSLYVLNAVGKQSRGFIAYLKNSSAKGFNVSSRQYFQTIINGDGWTRPGQPNKYFMQRIESKSTGLMQTAISIPITWPSADSSPEQGVVVGLGNFNTLENTVLPPGFGFAVFDRISGQVLFHSDAKRNLRENIYSATHDDPTLKAAVISSLPADDLTLTYHTEKIHGRLSRLQGTQWSLLVYHRDAIVDIVNFQYGSTALILAFSYFLFWLIGVPVAIAVLYKLGRLMFVERLILRDTKIQPPQWLYPVASLLPHYKRLAGILSAIIIAYVFCIHRYDLPEAYWLVLTPVLIGPLLWWAVLRSPDTQAKLMGHATAETFPVALNKKQSEQRNEKLTNLYAWFRFNVCLLVVFIAVLPTLVLLNENYDVHEKLWVEFSNWTISNRLKARSDSYHSSLPRIIGGEDIAEDNITSIWQGVYLPRTEIYSANLEKGANSTQPSKKIHVERQGYRSKDKYDKELLTDEDTLFIQLAPSDDPTKHCMYFPQSNAPNNKKFCSDPSTASNQSQELHRFINVLPEIDNDGSLLQSFKASVQNTFNKAQPDGGHPTTRLHKTYSGYNNTHNYKMSHFFPHTRPHESWTMTLLYIGLVGVSLLFISVLQGFMMRNFLSRQFETRLPAMARGFTQHSLETGGIIISPAGLPPEKAFRQLMNYMDIPKNDYGIEKTTPTDWDTKDVVELHNQKLLIIKNFYAIIKDRSKSARLIELILRKQHEGFSPVIQSDIDLHHWIYHRLHAEDMPEKEFYRWESLIINLPTFMLPVFDTSDNQQLKQSKASWQLPANSFRRTWEHCSEDEKIVLLGLRYEGVVNPRNKYTLSALYRRRVIEFRNGHFEFGDVNWHSFVGRQMHRAQFHTLVNNYKNSVWRAFRAPMLLSLLVLVLFIAYVAQDEMKLLFSLLGTVGAGAGVLSALSNRVKDLRGAASD